MFKVNNKDTGTTPLASLDIYFGQDRTKFVLVGRNDMNKGRQFHKKHPKKQENITGPLNALVKTRDCCNVLRKNFFYLKI